MHENSNIRQVALYGKGGIGKSTISSNLTAAFSLMGLKPAQIGCDPKADSVNTLMDGNFIETISEITRMLGNSEDVIKKALYRGYNDVLCIESGGPLPGQGCAGRGVLVALDLIRKYNILEQNNIDITVYDVLGDIVCGGFTQPIRHGFAEEVYIVTSGEYMSLYAANNIAFSIKQFAEQGLEVRVGGIIANLRNIPDEMEIVTNFAERLQIPLLKAIPRSDYVQKSELLGQTVVQAFFDSSQGIAYRELAETIYSNNQKAVPQPLTKRELVEMLNYKKVFAV